MKNEEKENKASKSTEKCCETYCRDGRGMFEAISGCCEGMSGPGDCRSMMAECMRKCRWFLLIPVILGILLLVIGYFLDAEVTKVLWMTAAGFVIVMGVFAFFMMGLSKKACS